MFPPVINCRGHLYEDGCCMEQNRHAEQKKKCWQMEFITNGWVLSSPQLFVWKPHPSKDEEKKNIVSVCF